MSLLLAALVVVAFCVLIERLNVAGIAREVVERTRRSLEALRDSDLDDAAKERLLRGNSLRLFGSFGTIVAVTTSSLLLPLSGVWALDRAGLAAFPEVMEILQRLDFLVAASVVGACVYYVSRRFARA